MQSDSVRGAPTSSSSPAAPWSIERGLGPVVRRWQASNWVRPCLCADETRAARDGEFAPLPSTLAPGIAAALRGRGVERLYAHQARAFEIAGRLGGDGARGFVVATPTASGKSLCFHLPVLQTLSEDPDARAIYLFPTKALARDQEAALRELVTASGIGAAAVVFDGDTPADARRAARERGGIVMTNPDMLHTGILPHHASWARTFENLRYVVVDEMHVYRGVFGSHVANVLRRLLRVAAFHGSRPKIVGATATIGNPRAHAARLFGLREDDLELLAESGAPQGERRMFLFNPPVVNAELGIRASYVKQATMLAADLVRARVPTIVFGQSRNSVEVMLRYLRDRVCGGRGRGAREMGEPGEPSERSEPIDPQRIMAYRGGYLPNERREIERRLREGDILAVVATNALELGIDIGDLDAVICASYPGSVAALMQRFGRAGRRKAQSIGVLVACSAPLDQYLAREPKAVFGAAVEEARIDPDNVEILIQHLKCAAFEMPFRVGEAFGSLGAEETGDALSFLSSHKVLHEAHGTYHWAADAYPANSVSLRSVGWDNVVIVDATGSEKVDPHRGEAPKGTTLAEMDWRGAHTMLHEQAIYQHDGETYQVERFDQENHKAYVRKVEPDYYTSAMTYTQVSVIEESAIGPLVASLDEGNQAAASSSWPSGWGEVAVVEKVVGYKKIKFFTHENAGYGDVRLPEMQMHTTAFWLTVPEALVASIAHGRSAVIDALRGIGTALETVATLALMCDPRDLGATMGDTATGEGEAGAGIAGIPRKVRGGAQPGFSPTLFLYEHVPGGIGLAERIFQQREALIAGALRLIESCACDGGCPACVGPGDFAATVSRKSVALEMLRGLVWREKPPPAPPCKQG
ncbi:MAG: DEAD/DEAH box helicase, partial [Polyangiaceae bacterium]